MNFYSILREELNVAHFMPYRRTKRVEARLADTRARILRAARQLVAEGGFREAQVATVAAVAGVATGTVYSYFPSKADLFAEVVSGSSQREVGVVATIAQAGGSAVQRLTDALRAFASRTLRGRRLAYALVAEPVDPEVESTRLEYRRALGKVLESILTDGINSGDFPPQNAEASAACLVGALLEGLIGPLAPTAGDVTDEGQELVRAIIAFCLRAVSGKEDREWSQHEVTGSSLPMKSIANRHRSKGTTRTRKTV